MSLILLAALAMQPAAQSPEAAAPAAPVKHKHEKKICRTLNVTGSRMPTTTCQTQAQWDAADQANQQSLDSPMPSGQAQH